jgi:hypothetical protein
VACVTKSAALFLSTMVLRSVSLAALLATAAAFAPVSVVRFCELHGRVRNGHSETIYLFMYCTSNDAVVSRHHALGSYETTSGEPLDDDASNSHTFFCCYIAARRCVLER